MKVCLPAVLLHLLMAVPLLAGEEPVAVTRGDLELAVEVEGRFQPCRGVPVLLAPAAWRGHYVVTRSAEPATPVDRGDVVLRFDDRDLREAVANARFELEIARQEAEIAASRRDLATAVEADGLARKRHEVERARLRFTGYRDHQLPQARRQAKLDEAQLRFGLENAREELAQLLRMYGEDELVDETEEIVLHRARWDVENREARLALWLLRRAHAVEFEEAPHLESLRLDLEWREAALDRAEQEAGLAARSREIEATRSRRSLEQKERNLERLAADLAAMTVRAPVAGLLFHGSAEEGLSKRYRPGQRINASEPVVTIVPPAGVAAVIQVPERERLRVRLGQEAELTPGIEGMGSVRGTVAEIRPLPSSGKHHVTVNLVSPTPPEVVGAACTVRILLGAVKGVLLVPVDRIERRDGAAWCRLPGDRRAQLELGLTDGKMVEVRSGLEEGDLVLPKGEDE
jgi:multidrug resistance efflux pump